MWFGLALHVPYPKSTLWDTEEQICSCLCPHRLCGVGTGVPGPPAVVWWLDVGVCGPEEHRGLPRVASGSEVLQSLSSKGFVVLSVSVPPWGRSQEQHRLGGEMGGHRAQQWLGAGHPTGATGGAPPHPSVPVGLRVCARAGPWPAGAAVGGRDLFHRRREPPAGNSGGTALLLGAGSSQATLGH